MEADRTEGLAERTGSAETLEAIRRRSRTLHGDGYHHPMGVPTGAACDVQWLLDYIDQMTVANMQPNAPRSATEAPHE